MVKEKILLLEPDQEQADLLAGWLKEEGYEINVLDSLQEVQPSLSKERFDILLVDTDYPESAEVFFKFCQTLKTDPRFTNLPVAIIIYKKDSKKIASAIEAGVDSFVFKPFETDSFLARIKTISKQLELKKQGKKALDLNYINYLVNLISEANREDFFLLSSIIFNNLIMDKVKIFLGEPVVFIMFKRIQELTGDNYAFMRQARFQNGKLLMDGVDESSKGVSVKILATGFQNFIYDFLYLVQTLTSDILMERSKL